MIIGDHVEFVLPLSTSRGVRLKGRIVELASDGVCVEYDHRKGPVTVWLFQRDVRLLGTEAEWEARVR